MSKYIYVHVADNNPIIDAQRVHLSDISLISNGSCENILCDCLDVLPLSERVSSTNELLKKIRVGGRLHLRFINLKLFSKHCYLDKLDSSTINNILMSVKSLVDDAHMEQIISSNNNFMLYSSSYDGLSQSIVIERKS